MDKKRALAFLVSGLVDCLFGGVLLLIWSGILPVDRLELGIPHSVIGLIGWLLSISGVVVVAFQATKLKAPDE